MKQDPVLTALSRTLLPQLAHGLRTPLAGETTQ